MVGIGIGMEEEDGDGGVALVKEGLEVFFHRFFICREEE